MVDIVTLTSLAVSYRTWPYSMKTGRSPLIYISTYRQLTLSISRNRNMATDVVIALQTGIVCRDMTPKYMSGMFLNLEQHAQRLELQMNGVSIRFALLKRY